MSRFTYTGEKRREIVFPIGGIGAGVLGLDGTGRLRDWEIFNRPNKGSLNGFSHFGIKAERGGKTLDARVMNADLMPGYMGNCIPNARFHGYGFGPHRYLLSGVPHFRDCVFHGEFPFAEVCFQDETFPGKVTLKAFNPFLPGDADNSSLPCGFFTASVENTGEEEMEYTFELSVNNPGKYRHHHREVRQGGFVGVALCDENPDAEDMENGCLLFAVPETERVALQQYWYRGSWFDNLGVFWRDFTAPGQLKNRAYDDGDEKVYEDVATIAVTAKVQPGATWSQRFLIAWRYPNCKNYWSNPDDEADAAVLKRTWKPWYATRFDGAEAVAEYAFSQWDDLEAETQKFHDALYASDLPDVALEAVTANLSQLKSATCMRLEDGSFYAFEGVHANSGSCEGSCTHVWNYAFALPYLFPALERSMRELDYARNQRPDGGMSFRLQLPLGRRRSGFRPCVDGQMGGVIKTYREWKILGDDAWLRKLWPMVRKSVEFAWADTNADRWDPDKSGVISGRQHHTLDMELFGPNSWLNSFYLGALKAASEMARAMDENDFAETCDVLYRQGREYTQRELFNGEYFQQKIDLRDKSVLNPYCQGNNLTGGGTMETYWSDEAGQLKYQIGEGCGTDQVLGQWMCELSGVGEILDRQMVDSALASIYRYNFKQSMRNHFNPCRIYALNDESALVICDWPKGKEKPVVPVPYAEEAMNGFEYQAATHMILHGMEKEGLDVVRGIRDRYDGAKRNPWNEFECGSNYARSLASYALLLVYSGFWCDMTRGEVGFAPLHGTGKFFWSMEGAWGTFQANPAGSVLQVLHGILRLERWGVPEAEKVRQIRRGLETLSFRETDGLIKLECATELHAGEMLEALR